MYISMRYSHVLYVYIYLVSIQLCDVYSTRSQDFKANWLKDFSMVIIFGLTKWYRQISYRKTGTCLMSTKLPLRNNAAKKVRQPGIEPGSIAWKATMLTFTPPTLDIWIKNRWSQDQQCCIASKGGYHEVKAISRICFLFCPFNYFCCYGN